MDDRVGSEDLVVGDCAGRRVEAPEKGDRVGRVTALGIELVAQLQPGGQGGHGGGRHASAGIPGHGQANVGPVAQHLGREDFVSHGRHASFGRMVGLGDRGVQRDAAEPSFKIASFIGKSHYGLKRRVRRLGHGIDYGLAKHRY